MQAERKRQRLVDPRKVRVPGRAPRWIVPAVRVVLVTSDGLVAAFSFILAFSFREQLSAFAPDGDLAWSQRFAPYGALLLFVVFIRLLSLRYCDLYRVRGEFSVVDDALRVFKATAIGSLLIVAAAVTYPGSVRFLAVSYATGRVVVDFFLAFTSTALIPLLIRTIP